MTAAACDCLIVQPIDPAAVRVLVEAGLRVHVAAATALATLRPHLAVARAVITRNHGLSAEEIAAAPNLLVLGVHGTGTDKVHKPSLAARGIPLFNTPGANAQSVAELAIGLMLSCARALVDADNAARAGDGSFRLTRRTVELSGRRLGLIGYGLIARRVARLAQAFGMEVAVVSRSSSDEMLAADGVARMTDIDALCAWADVVSLHGVPGEQPVMNAARLALIGPEGILVNTARGALVDEAALATALKTGTIAAAGLDVLVCEPIRSDHPLLTAPNLILSPHLGGSTVEALERTGQQVVAKVLAELARIGALASARDEVGHGA